MTKQGNQNLIQLIQKLIKLNETITNSTTIPICEKNCTKGLIKTVKGAWGTTNQHISQFFGNLFLNFMELRDLRLFKNKFYSYSVHQKIKSNRKSVSAQAHTTLRVMCFFCQSYFFSQWEYYNINDITRQFDTYYNNRLQYYNYISRYQSSAFLRPFLCLDTNTTIKTNNSKVIYTTFATTTIWTTTPVIPTNSPQNKSKYKLYFSANNSAYS